MPTQIQAILADKGDRVHTIGRDDDATRAAARMKSLGIAALVVTENMRVVGLVGERDIVLAVADDAASITSLTVNDVMEKQPETCTPTDRIHEVMETMTRKRRRHIPVVDDDGSLCGIVSIGDMIKFRLHQMELETRVLRDAYLTKH